MSALPADKMSLYLHDLGALLKEEALAAHSELQEASSDDKLYAQGQLMAFYRVISMMQEQARAFDIDLKTLALDDIYPDRDLL